MNYFYLIASDVVDGFNNKFSGLSCAEENLKDKKWPLYKHTLYKNTVKPGDLCLIYIAGKGELSRHFIAKFKILDVVDRPYFEEVKNPIKKINKIIRVSEMQKFNNPVNIKSIFNDLSFIRGHEERWGLVMQGGCRKLVKEDFDLIVEKSVT